MTLCAVALLCADVGAAAAQSLDGQGSDRFVTFVARECPTYTDVMANRARNDIQESLEDLGKNSVYAAGSGIAPTVEADNDPACTPIENWTFTLGTGIRGRASTGPWGALSIVTNPFATSIVTQASVPLRDADGRIVAGQTIAGAVTTELTPQQAALAVPSSSLWVQGGTTTDPVLDQRFPGTYGFAALRCSIDNLNGDNVEWISYPSGAEHVFCYAYYVKPPPTGGSITIRKEVTGLDGATERFVFGGNVSYNPGGIFTLDVDKGKAASQTFYRGAGPTPWTIRETVPDGWRLTGLACAKKGGSEISTSIAKAEVSIVLAPRDQVTCTFTDAPRPPAGQLFLRKHTIDGIGTFGFQVEPLDPDGESASAEATTLLPGTPRDADPNPLVLPPGRYRITETAPPAPGGFWRLGAVNCVDEFLTPSDGAVEITVRSGAGATCTFINRLVHPGEIAISKQTFGATGTAGFKITSVADPRKVYEQAATTEAVGRPELALGDVTRGLPLGKYVIQEIEPESSTGDWTLTGVVCNGQPLPATQGRVTIRLTRSDPEVRCQFDNGFTRSDTPPPDPPGPTPEPGGPTPDLSIEKVADRGAAGVGERVTFRVRVRNTGGAAAEEVVVVDQPGRGLVPVRVPGNCVVRALIVCRIPYVSAGGETMLTFTMRIGRDAPATVTNRAAVGSADAEARVRNNRAVAGVVARRDPCGPLRIVRPGLARAAC